MYEIDVLVIGSEGAGARAAIAAHDQGARVTVVTKGRMGKCGVTMLAGADITLDGGSASKIGLKGNEDDSKERYFRDIVIQGYYLNNQRLVEVYVRDAPARAKELIDWGIKYSWDGRRAIITEGRDIVRVLTEQVRKRGIEVVEDTMMTDLLLSEGKIAGAIGINIRNGEILTFKSKAVIIATGGWHRAYSFTTGSEGMTGDGHAMAYKAGAELVNMEMVTFCPNTILWPPSLRGDIFLYIIGESFGSLLDKRGEPYLKEYDPRTYKIATTTEWNKLILSLASERVVRSRRGSLHGGTYFSLKTIPWNIVEMAKEQYPGWMWQATNYTELMNWLKEGNAVEVGPAAHYFEGGIRINEKCETAIPGLYAAGECAGGLFGANRVSSAITQILVQGAIAGASASQYANKASPIEIDVKQVKSLEKKLLRPFEIKQGISPVELRKKIQKVSDDCMWVIRNGEGIKRAINEYQTMATKDLVNLAIKTGTRRYNKEWIEAVGLENLLTVLLASSRSAFVRKESRGVHFRSDCPRTNNDEWLKEIVTRQVNGKMKLYARPVTVTAVKPPKGKTTFEQGIINAVEALER